MKKLFTLFFILSATTVFAQQYKITVKYDENGNRILRMRECYADCNGGKPAPPPDSTQNTPNDVAIYADSLLGSYSFQLYPNPTEGGLTLLLGNAIMLRQKCEIIVTDATGREIMHRQVTEMVTHYDIGSSADGLYLFTLVAGERRQALKIIKKTK